MPEERLPNRGDIDAWVLQREQACRVGRQTSGGVGEVEAEWLGFCPEGNGWRHARALRRRAAGYF